MQKKSELNNHVWVKHLVFKSILPKFWKSGKNKISYDILLLIFEIIEKHSLILNKYLIRSLNLLYGNDVTDIIKEPELFKYHILMYVKRNPVCLENAVFELYSSEKKDDSFDIGPFCEDLNINRNTLQRIISNSSYNDIKILNNGAVLELDREREKSKLLYAQFCTLLNLLSGSSLTENWIKTRIRQVKRKRDLLNKKHTADNVRESVTYFRTTFGGPELRCNIDIELNVNDAIIMSLYQEQQNNSNKENIK